MRNLNQFPVEILRLIFDELDAKSIANLRLVTRRISDVASEHWLTCQNEVRFFMRKEDLSILSGLLRYPDSCYYKNIKSLICLFNSPGPAEICHGHRRLYQEWVEILGANEDFAVLEKVVKRLPNLEKITVECCHFMDLFRQDGRGGNGGGKKTWNRIENALEIIGRVHAVSTRQLRAVLLAVQKAGHTKLQSIDATYMHLDMLCEKQSFGIHNMTASVLENLHTLYLHIEDWHDGYKLPPSSSSSRREQGHDEHGEHEHGTFRQALVRMRNLTDLQLFLPLSAAVPLSRLIQPNHVWPKLQGVDIIGFDMRREELLHFVKLHRPTLKTFTLITAGSTVDMWSAKLFTLEDVLYEVRMGTSS